MSSACSQAVQLPEIVAIILEQLQDKKTLFAALQVNRLWAAEATTLLWRVFPSILDLARIEDVKRVQYYANKISVLSIQLDKDQDGVHLKLQGVYFARLKYLSMGFRGYKEEQIFSQYLQPHLRKMIIFGGPISGSYLVQIQALCPALRDLSLSHVSGTITTVGLLDFLDGVPSLTNIHLWGGLENVISDELYYHLASRPNLEALTTGNDKILTLGFIKGMQKVVDQPFPKLGHLLCFTESNAFSQLNRHLHGLTSLHLHLVDATSKTLFDICSCTSLVNLGLSYHDSHFDAISHFPPEGLLALARSCSHLQTFTATSDRFSRGDTGSIANITDDVIRQFVALLPQLTHFTLGMGTDVTERALRLLGEGCSDLEDCSFNGRSFDLQLLGSRGPVLFPNIDSLRLNPIEDCVACLQLEPMPEDCISATMVAEILHHHAPRMRTLKLGGSKSLVREVGEKWRRSECHGETLYFIQL